MMMTRQLFEQIVGAERSTETTVTAETLAEIERLRTEGRKILTALQEGNLQVFPWLAE
jgi:hypothetical protein